MGCDWPSGCRSSGSDCAGAANGRTGAAGTHAGAVDRDDATREHAPWTDCPHAGMHLNGPCTPRHGGDAPDEDWPIRVGSSAGAGARAR